MRVQEMKRELRECCWRCWTKSGLVSLGSAILGSPGSCMSRDPIFKQHNLLLP